MSPFTFSVVLFSLFFNAVAYAKVSEAECSPVDYSSRFVPPKNQGNAGFCYSFAASDLLSEAASVKPPDTVSAFYVGAEYISMSQPEVQAANKAISFDNPKREPLPAMGSMGGGFVGTFDAETENYRSHDPSGKPLLRREGGNTDLIAAQIINQGQACLEKDVRSEILGPDHTDSEVQNFFLNQIGHMAGGDEVNALRNTKAYRDLQTTCMVSPPLKGLDQLRPFKESLQDWFAAKLRKRVNDECKNPVPLNRLKVHSRSFTSQDKNPESIAYMMSVFDEGRPFALHYDMGLLRKWPAGRESWHSSIVTGRRWNKEKNTCELAIKNSWGEDCKEALEVGTCEKGRWWLDTEKLANSKSEVIWIDKNAKVK